jgi:biopolymer transport protein ExbB
MLHELASGWLGTLAQAAPAPGAGGAAAPPAADAGPSLWQYIEDGGPVGFLLIGLSVTALALFVRNLVEFRMQKVAPEGVLDRIEALFREGKFREAEQFCSLAENDCFVSRVIARALHRCHASPLGMMEFRAAIEEAGADESDKLHRLNDWIGIIAAVGPMLGLLGTVIGMIGAFRTIGTLTGAERSNQLATFMSMALVNTAQGLVVAVPCTIAFAVFRRRADELVSKVGTRLEVLNTIATSVMTPRAGRGPVAPLPVPPPAGAIPRAPKAPVPTAS